MTQPIESPEARAARELDADRERIDARLREPLPARVESMLRDERRWVERQRRALERVKVCCDAVLHAAGAASAVTLRDVTSMGAGIDVAHAPPVGANVQLEIPGLRGRPRLDAVVRHASEETHRAGLEFVPAGETARKVAEEIVRGFASCEDD